MGWLVMVSYKGIIFCYTSHILSLKRLRNKLYLRFMDAYLHGLLSLESFIFAFLAAFILGISKAGVKGIAVLIVTLMALAFGGKSSTGMLMPLLIVGDVFAITYYHRYTHAYMVGKKENKNHSNPLELWQFYGNYGGNYDHDR